ncbi:polysaccharide biosynthesis/export family protein [Aeromonas veronii]|uniref:polysaccharide biosynthesis/export family protein n=1 Tax=Aeromonas veronii TaxID=654 RepID=UPI003C706049
MPVADDYVLGPGDEIRVQLYGKENANYTLPIGREGFIDFPTLGPIAASGQTFQQLRSELESRIKEQKNRGRGVCQLRCPAHHAGVCDGRCLSPRCL